MDAVVSEGMFASYLDSQGLLYERHFRVSGDKNVDFCIAGDPRIHCDVKEIRPSSNASTEIDAYAHLREDLSDLRKKFGRNRPTGPVVLVTVNFSGQMFTGFSVARAMLGDVAAEFSSEGRSSIGHLLRGNAAVTRAHKRAIAGIFVYDCQYQGSHALFLNPYADFPVPGDSFPHVRRVIVVKSASEEQLHDLSKLTFWSCDEPAL
jgi:hypothetical protein